MKMWRLASDDPEEEEEGTSAEQTKKEMMDHLHEFFPDEGWEDEAEVAIYYFCNDYHSGQNSDYYSILSTSPYTPGAMSHLNAEGDTVKIMYHELEEQFEDGSTEHGEVGKKLKHLKEEALMDCGFRGHDMAEWEDNFNENERATALSTCKECGEWVQVDTNPDANGIDVGGPAVAIHCEEKIEQATTQELYREFGIDE